LPQPTVTVSC